MSKTQDEKVLDFIELTGEIVNRSQAMLVEKQATADKCAKLIPLVVQALIEHERIGPHEKEAAEKVLTDPARVLEILIKTAAHRNSTERTQLGKPAETQKSANNYSSLNDNYVGRRTRPQKAESDLAFERKLGFNS